MDLSKERGVSRVAAVIVVVVILAIAAGAVYYYSTVSSTTSTSSSSSNSTSSASSTASTTTSSTGSSTSSSTIRVVNTENFPTADPAFADGTSIEFKGLFYEALLSVTANGAFAPSLATSWTISPSGLNYTLTLRQGVIFHDGTPFNSSAVVLSFQRMKTIGPKLAAIVINYLNVIHAVTATGTYSVRVDLTFPNPAFLATLAAIDILPMVSPSAVKAHEINSTEMAAGWFANHEDGTGPYTMTSFVSSVSYAGTAFPQYWKGWSGSHFKNVVVTWVSNPSTRALEVESGEADAAYSLPISSLAALNSSGKYHVNIEKASAVTYLMMDLSNPYLSQVNFRKAIAYAINYTALLHTVEPISTAGRGPIPSSMFAFNNSLPYPKQNITLAKHYLAMTNYTSAGAPDLTLVWNSYSWKQQTAEAIQSNLFAIGINVVVKQLTFPVLTQGLEHPGTYPFYIFFQSADTVDSYSFLNSIYNGALVSNPPSNPPSDIQAMLIQAQHDASDPAKFSADLMHIQSLAAQNQYQIFLYDLADNFVSLKSTVATNFIPLYGDIPDFGLDYYAMSPTQ